MTWLRRSGQAWKIQGSFLCNVLAYAGITLSIVLSWEAVPWLLVVVAFGSLVLLVLAKILVALPRCAVCGLWLESSSAGRHQRRPISWLTSIEACPICGDDGAATPDSRRRWRLSGGAAEPPYWSRARLAIAVALVVGVPLLAGMLADYAAPFIVARH